MIDERKLLAALQDGLPLCPRPYAALAQRIGCDEQALIARIRDMRDSGDIKRFGVVVRHRKLGYRANAMVVWDVDDSRVDELGQCFGQFDFVTLSYRRPRHLPDWPYNLFCMIHGQDREQVMQHLSFMIDRCGVADIRHEVLFSTRCFKQRGAVYIHNDSVDDERMELKHA